MAKRPEVVADLQPIPDAKVSMLVVAYGVVVPLGTPDALVTEVVQPDLTVSVLGVPEAKVGWLRSGG